MSAHFANHACTLVFLIEALLKIAAFTFAGYIRDRWHQYDFAIVLLSSVDWALSLAELSFAANPTFIRIFRIVRVFRVLRALRILKFAKGLQALLALLLSTLPELLNVLGVFLVVLLVYSLLAMELFGDVTARRAPNPQPAHQRRRPA